MSDAESANGLEVSRWEKGFQFRGTRGYIDVRQQCENYQNWSWNRGKVSVSSNDLRELPEEEDFFEGFGGRDRWWWIVQRCFETTKLSEGIMTTFRRFSHAF